MIKLWKTQLELKSNYCKTICFFLVYFSIALSIQILLKLDRV